MLQFLRKLSFVKYNNKNQGYFLKGAAVIFLFLAFFSLFAAVRADFVLDGDFLPSGESGVGTGSHLGTQAARWKSVNNIIYFGQGNKVGIGSQSPAGMLFVDGILRLNTTESKPSCSSQTRGTLWVIQEGTSTADRVELCVQNSGGSPSWVSLIN